MDLSRRRFIKLSGLSALGAVVFNGCDIPEVELQVQSSLDIPEDTPSGGEVWYATLVNQGGGSEGVIVRVIEGRAKKVEGNPDYPLNRGSHSARSEAALQELYHPDRIESPLQNGAPVAWGDAMSALNSALDGGKALIITDPLRGQLASIVSRFTEATGSDHVQLEPLSRLALQNSIKSTFGQDQIPHFDIRNARCILSFGADWLGTWVSPESHSQQYGEFREGGDHGEERGYLIHVDSRFSQTTANADRWIPVKPGMEGLLALGIAHVIVQKGLASGDVEKAFEGGASSLDSYTPESVARQIGLTEYLGDASRAAGMIEEVAVRFATQGPSIAIAGDSAGGHSNGAFNLAAAYALNHLVGSVGVTGGVNYNPDFPVNVPRSGVGQSLGDWVSTIAKINSGEYSTVIVRGCDPLHGLPDHLGLREALQSVSTVVSISPTPNETSGVAQWVLPELTQLEMWGDDIPDPSPGYPVMGLQQPVVRPFKDGRSFGDLLLSVASMRSLDGAWPSDMQGALKDAARELHKLNRGSVTSGNFDDFWVGVLQRGGWWDVKSTGASNQGAGKAVDPGSFSMPQYSGGGEHHLIPFRSASIWEGQGADLPWLQAAPDPISTGVWQTWVEINRKEAATLDISEGDILELTNNENGQSIEVIAYPMPAIPEGVLGVPLGQGHTSVAGRYARDRGANVLDVLSGTAETVTNAHAWAATKVTMTKTGRKTRMVKFEGVAATDQIEEWPVVLLTDH